MQLCMWISTQFLSIANWIQNENEINKLTTRERNVPITVAIIKGNISICCCCCCCYAFSSIRLQCNMHLHSFFCSFCCQFNHKDICSQLSLLIFYICRFCFCYSWSAKFNLDQNRIGRKMIKKKHSNLFYLINQFDSNNNIDRGIKWRGKSIYGHFCLD